MVELTTCRAQNAISGFVVFFATAYLNFLAATLALRISHLPPYWDIYTGGKRLTDETEKRGVAGDTNAAETNLGHERQEKQD